MWCLNNKYKSDVPFRKFGSIKIGNNCFIGAKSIILPGVTIGDNCIVAAGSVVAKSVASGTIVDGVPAKYIMSIDDYYMKRLRFKNEIDEINFNKDRETELLRIYCK